VEQSEITTTYSAVGETGTYILDTPAGYEATRPSPVVFDLHGYIEPASFEHLGTGLSAYGDDHGFITVTPQVDESGAARWSYGPHSQDVAYLASLLTHLEQTHCVDERRVFFTGLSMGAFETSAVACELSGRVAAVAPVAGLQAYPWCRPSRPVPVVTFHGTADPYVAFEGGPGPEALNLPATDGSGMTVGEELKKDPSAYGNPLPEPIPVQVAEWAKRNGCGTAPSKRQIASDVILEAYPCAHEASVRFYVVEGGGHTWPGGTPGIYPLAEVGKMTTSISANAIMWAFFEAHPLQGAIG
jgi:polyhydroxybutyrate depolymerase